MIRIGVAMLVAVGLAVGIWLIWPGDELTEGSATTTSADPEPTVHSTTSTAVATSVGAGTPVPTSAREASHVVTTVEEAEEILRELWFGWFEGIYNQDEDRIREVVVTQAQVETAKESFGVVFEAAPEPEHLSFSGIEILRSDHSCLAVWSVLTLEGFRTGSSGNVHVLRRVDDTWRRLASWQYKEDLWVSDCESE